MNTRIQKCIYVVAILVREGDLYPLTDRGRANPEEEKTNMQCSNRNQKRRSSVPYPRDIVACPKDETRKKKRKEYVDHARSVCAEVAE